MKATVNEMHKSMLRFKRLKQARDDEHKSMQSSRQEQPANMQGTTRETREHVKQVRYERT